MITNKQSVLSEIFKNFYVQTLMQLMIFEKLINNLPDTTRASFGPQV